MTELEDRPVVARDVGDREGLTTVEKNKVTFFWGGINETILYVDCGGGYMTTCIYQISEKCLLKRVTSVVCELKF